MCIDWHSNIGNGELDGTPLTLISIVENWCRYCNILSYNTCCLGLSVSVKFGVALTISVCTEIAQRFIYHCFRSSKPSKRLCYHCHLMWLLSQIIIRFYPHQKGFYIKKRRCFRILFSSFGKSCEIHHWPFRSLDRPDLIIDFWEYDIPFESRMRLPYPTTRTASFKNRACLHSATCQIPMSLPVTRLTT